jgi:hypothetical protein
VGLLGWLNTKPKAALGKTESLFLPATLPVTLPAFFMRVSLVIAPYKFIFTTHLAQKLLFAALKPMTSSS